jgi:hypothetical protein
LRIHEQWKGRIVKWQPRRKQRRLARRNTSLQSRQKAKGTPKASPKFWWEENHPQRLVLVAGFL